MTASHSVEGDRTIEKRETEVECRQIESEITEKR